MIKILVAHDENCLIGKNNKMPWNIKDELKHFQKTTNNKKILFGRKTYEGIDNKLGNRIIYILTRSKNIKFNKNEEVNIINDYKMIVNKYHKNLKDDIYICGGSEIYELFLPFADEIIISIINGKYIGDKYFPSWNKDLFQEENKIVKKEFTKYYFKRKN